ncbi:MAG: LytTR family DNA-binding domain-containing protein [Bacteroidota bacterium]|nr:LytTR family DNA-binding domain-containing protein [Bacteroidota bacterium]
MNFPIFNKPYPYGKSVSSKLKLSLIISLFVAIFLIVLQPFGLHNFKSGNKMLIISGYGLVSFVLLIINLILIPLLFKNIFNEDRWKVKSQILYLFLILFTIGLGNFFYTVIVFGFSSNLEVFLIFQLFTLIVGGFPIIITTLLTQNKLLTRNLKEAANLNSKIHNNSFSNNSELVTFNSDNKNENLNILLSDFLYIKSQGNYAQVYYLDNELVKSELLRITLTKMLNNLRSYTSIFRCHRAYIVNLDKIYNIEGNSQGYKLKLENSQEIIPVSRGFLDSFNKLISKQ